MSLKIKQIEINNFKAFQEFKLELDGRHLLLYGSNGSGKSSFYWALYTFLQSAAKSTPEVSKYFDASKDQMLLNTHLDWETNPGSIKILFKDEWVERSMGISKNTHDTKDHPWILKGDLASDFISYRFFFGFSDFKNSEQFNIWPLFESEILPFCVSTTGEKPLDLWKKICTEEPNPMRYSGEYGSISYDLYHKAVIDFGNVLIPIVDKISVEAQKFYNNHFKCDDVIPVEFKLKLTRKPHSRGRNRRDFSFGHPIITFGVKIGDKEIKKPQSHLNEAKMTQIALSVRFAASVVNLHESDLKLLVLDDLLVSLDMDNRMKVVELILGPGFEKYQKIILTHDLGFFQEFKRIIGTNHQEWLFQKLFGDAKSGPKVTNVKSSLEMAQQFLANDQIAECGNQLRKCVEENLTSFLVEAKKKKGIDSLVDRGSFASLHQKLNEACSELSLGSYREFAELLQAQFTLDQLQVLVSPDEIDPSIFAAATREERREKGKIIAKLYAARPNLHQCIIELLSDASRKQLNALKLLDEVRRIKDRILNPASHAGTTPLYTKEAEDAIKVIKSLEPALNAALATL